MPIIFADEILRKQKDVAHIPIGPVGELSNYDQMRQECICMKLIHFNSPETISVLGDFLYDDKDVPKLPRQCDYFANNGKAAADKFR